MGCPIRAIAIYFRQIRSVRLVVVGGLTDVPVSEGIKILGKLGDCLLHSGAQFDGVNVATDEVTSSV
jgi:hypothetical protein